MVAPDTRSETGSLGGLGQAAVREGQASLSVFWRVFWKVTAATTALFFLLFFSMHYDDLLGPWAQVAFWPAP